MAERSNAAVLKTVDCNRSGGSNPSFSAEGLKRDFSKFLKKAKIHEKPCKSNDLQGFFFYTAFQYFQKQTKSSWRIRGTG